MTSIDRSDGGLSIDVCAAYREGLLRSRHAPRPAVYAQPVRCAWRGPIVLTDEPGPDGLYWRAAPGPWPGPAEIPEWRGVGA